MEYKLGELVEQVTETNSELNFGLNDIVGVTIDKKIIPTIANLKETDLKKFIIVSPNDFIYNPRTHGKKIGLGYNNTYRKYIATWNNNTFRVKHNQREVITPDYLYLYFNREIWDKEACFNSWGSSTVVFSWDSFCDMKINLPDIEEQKKIVKEYQAIEKRKGILMEFNNQLEKMIDCTFADNINKIENNTAPVYTFGDVITGKTPSTYNKDYYNSNDIPFIKTPDMHDGVFVIKTNEYLSKKGADSQNNKYIPPYTVIMSCIGSAGELAITTGKVQTNQQINAVVTKYPYFLYSALKKAKRDLLVLGDGSTTMLNINKTDFSNFLITSCDDNSKEKIENTLKPLFKLIEMNSKEIYTLSKYKDLLLNKIA